MQHLLQQSYARVDEVVTQGKEQKGAVSKPTDCESKPSGELSSRSLAFLQQYLEAILLFESFIGDKSIEMIMKMQMHDMVIQILTNLNKTIKLAFTCSSDILNDHDHQSAHNFGPLIYQIYEIFTAHNERALFLQHFTNIVSKDMEEAPNSLPKDLNHHLKITEFIQTYLAFHIEMLNSSNEIAERAVQDIAAEIECIFAKIMFLTPMPPNGPQLIDHLSTWVQTHKEKDFTGDISLIEQIESHLEKINPLQFTLGERVIPLIESLQFQDKITQNKKTIQNILVLFKTNFDQAYWQNDITKYTVFPATSTDQHPEFYKEILRQTSMEDERDIVQAVLSANKNKLSH